MSNSVFLLNSLFPLDALKENLYYSNLTRDFCKLSNFQIVFKDRLVLLFLLLLYLLRDSGQNRNLPFLIVLARGKLSIELLSIHFLLPTRFQSDRLLNKSVEKFHHLPSNPMLFHQYLRLFHHSMMKMEYYCLNYYLITQMNCHLNLVNPFHMLLSLFF